MVLVSSNKRSPSVLIIGVVTCAMSCGRSEFTRPDDVPFGAVMVNGPKTVWWQNCRVGSGTGAAVVCQIWNARGQMLFNEPFLPYDEHGQLSAGELKIADVPVHGDKDQCVPGADHVCLTNGRTLLPQSRFGVLKRSLDKIHGQ